jgi:restriction system protein
MHMTLWVVRAGRHGEQEQTAIDYNLVTIGWNELQIF